MNALLEAALEVSYFMEERHWKFCLIGGLAVQQWGEPRTTLDADFTLLTGWGEEEQYVDRLLERFESRLSGARDFALSRRILLLKSSKGIDIDVALGALPFEEGMIARAKSVEFSPGLSLPCCTPEDLFIMKVFAGRSRDWIDARGVALRNRNLDATYMLRHIEELCALRDDSESVGRARMLLEELQ